MHGQNNDDSTEITTGEAGWDDDGQGYSGEPTAILRPTQKPMPREGSCIQMPSCFGYLCISLVLTCVQT